MQLESPEALGRWLKDNCLKMQRQVSSERSDTTKSFVTRAKEYVKEHYADSDLSIEMLCGHLNVSAAYFSTVFKKETGKTFIQIDRLPYGDGGGAFADAERKNVCHRGEGRLSGP